MGSWDGDDFRLSPNLALVSWDGEIKRKKGAKQPIPLPLRGSGSVREFVRSPRGCLQASPGGDRWARAVVRASAFFYFPCSVLLGGCTMGICRRCARVFPAVFYAGEQQGAHNFLLKCSNKSFFTFFGLKLGRKFSYLLWHHSSIRLTIRVLTMGNFLLSIFCPAKIMKVSERIKISCIRVVLQKKSSK